jgi:hypothetical protein
MQANAQLVSYSYFLLRQITAEVQLTYWNHEMPGRLSDLVNQAVVLTVSLERAQVLLKQITAEVQVIYRNHEMPDRLFDLVNESVLLAVVLEQAVPVGPVANEAELAGDWVEEGGGRVRRSRRIAVVSHLQGRRWRR